MIVVIRNQEMQQIKAMFSKDPQDIYLNTKAVLALRRVRFNFAMLYHSQLIFFVAFNGIQRECHCCSNCNSGRTAASY